MLTLCKIQSYTTIVSGRYIGDQYLKAAKASLLACHSYCLGLGDTTFANLLTGTYHSGDRYIVIEMNGVHLSIRRQPSLLYSKYSIYNRHAKEQVGSFRFKAEWFGKTAGLLTTRQAYTFKQLVASSLFKPTTWGWYKFALYNSDACIVFKGKYSQSVFAGQIEMNGSGNYFEAILGVFVIDERERITQERPS